MSIFILGSSGMLGRYIYKYLSPHYNIIEINREFLNAEFITEQDITSRLLDLNFKPDDIVINCIGIIKPLVDKFGYISTIKVNSLFPRYLSKSIKYLNGKLIHITTDCVWNGLTGNYNENFPHNATDIYGKSKSLGEPEDCTVIRTSIIGEEIKNNRSLVEWVKSNKDGTVNGFLNHHWNGVTCLELAKFVKKEFLIKNNFWKGSRHVFSNKVSKFELLNLINKSYNLNIEIKATETPTICDRSMSSIYDVSSYQIQDLEKQIEEMSNFSDNLL